MHQVHTLGEDILSELERHNIRADEVPTLVEDFARLGPGKHFPGFGTDPAVIREMVQSLAAIRSMLRAHHDEPWGD